MASAAKSVPELSQPDYGIDAPVTLRRMLIRGVLLMIFAAVVYSANREGNPRAGAVISLIAGAAGAAFAAAGGIMYWSSKVGKLRLRDRILDSIAWKGDEKVLDAGCGRGMMLMGAARKLSSGRATGCDLWSNAGQAKNSADFTKANAAAEGVSGKVKIDTADIRRMPYTDASFDVVLSSLAIHNIPGEDQRRKALDEIWRVLKPGGRVVVLDIFHTGEYARYLESKGARVELSPLSLLWCVPTRWLAAVKPG